MVEKVHNKITTLFVLYTSFSISTFAGYVYVFQSQLRDYIYFLHINSKRKFNSGLASHTSKYFSILDTKQHFINQFNKITLISKENILNE